MTNIENLPMVHKSNAEYNHEFDSIPCPFYNTHSMPINQRQRRTQADAHLKRYFPSLTEDQRRPICEMITNNFDANYSPLKKEQDSRDAIGQGASFEEFTIAIGRNMAHIEPTGVEQERLAYILRKVWTM